MKRFPKFLGTIILTVGIGTSIVLAEGYNFSQSIYKLGMEHKDVKVIQEALRKDGNYTYGKTTTYFGPITEKAVKAFQKEHGLDVDGIVGSSTLQKMESLGLIHSTEVKSRNSIVSSLGNYVFSQKVYKFGMEHKDIQVIQEALRKDGVFTYEKTTCYFGSITEKAVKRFQKKYGLKADGIVGVATLNKMKEIGLLPASATIKKTAISRGIPKRKFGEYLDWWKEVSGKIIKRQDILLIEDLATRKRFQVKMTAGTNHADCEALTKEDTAIMKEIWGGLSWDRRPVLVYKDDRVIAASMSFMPHAGVDGKPAGQTVSNRSGGFGRGYNYDFIKGNGMDGHVDLHFKNSLRHKDDRKDPQHQAAIKKAAGIN